jgi:DNA-binding transcriptional ArsR family regulator
MKAGPDIARMAALIGDPGRSNMLTALMSGRALTASELAQEASITAQTASSHLGKLEAGGLISATKQGRHRYYRLAGNSIAGVLEGLMGLAAEAGHLRVRTGPKDPELRRARVCYDHLAGEFGVRMYDSLIARRLLVENGAGLDVSDAGTAFLANLGIHLPLRNKSRRPLCRSCLDWSARRNHLAGSLGAALLTRFQELKWASRLPDTRIIRFSRRGETAFAEAFALPSGASAE